MLSLTAVPTSVGLLGSYSSVLWRMVCESLAMLLPVNFPCQAVNRLLLPFAPLSQVEVISGADLECLGFSAQLYRLSV